VQGDERDVIFISVAYARNAQGYLPMRFGPVSADGGERRLNVLISRAKQRCEVFSSITADDIDLERGKGKGVAALKVFLQYAATGQLALAGISGRDLESPLEEDVYEALTAQGLQVQTQIGIAGFFIDLAVVDPEQPGRYLLGIECDGMSYHHSRSRATVTACASPCWRARAGRCCASGAATGSASRVPRPSACWPPSKLPGSARRPNQFSR
jgi:hypothetical protein